MKYIKFLRFDLRNGLLKKYMSYIGIALFTAIVFLDCQSVCRSFDTGFTLGEYFMYLYGGIKKYVPTPGEPFKVPYLWLLNHLLILYFTLNYTSADLNGFGQQTIYRSGGRVTWWLSKCSWQVIAICMYYFASWAVLVLLAVASRETISLEITQNVHLYLDFGKTLIPFEQIDLSTELLLLPLLFTVSIGLMQLTLSIIIKPAFAYIISATICIMSSHTQSPLLFGNYAMAARCNKVITDGMNATVGEVSMITLSVICVALGAVRFRRYDILSREE